MSCSKNGLQPQIDLEHQRCHSIVVTRRGETAVRLLFQLNVFTIKLCVPQVKCVRCLTDELRRGGNRDRSQLIPPGLHPEEVRYLQSYVRIQQGKSAALVEGTQHRRPKVDFFLIVPLYYSESDIFL